MEIAVTVDPRRCVASQTCVRAEPGLFELGPGGFSRPTRARFTEDDLPRLLEAEDSCPTGAIRVEVEEG